MQFDRNKSLQQLDGQDWGEPNFDSHLVTECHRLELMEELGGSADANGHDVGSNETNIFIFTSDPEATFHRAKPVLERRQQLRAVTAAYREVSGERYTVIWPEGSRAGFRVI